MFPTVAQYAQALDELFSGKTKEERRSLVEKLSGYLKTKGEEKRLPLILKKLEERVRDREGMVAVTVMTAHDVPEDMREKLTQRAERLFGEKKMEPSFVTEPSVLGGVAFRTKEKLYDATLRTTLKKMSQEIS